MNHRKTPEPADRSPSKSQRKRDARELFELGRDLVRLNPVHLQKIPLGDELIEAIEFARGIHSHGARKRQLQFIARLLRNTDAAPVRAALEAAGMEARQLAARHHRVEAWRDRLLEDGDAAVAELVESCPSASPQNLRQLLRNARREANSGKPPSAARKLFKLLRDLDESENLPLPE